MLGLQTPIRLLPKMQAPIAKKFDHLELTTLNDALWYFPFRHEDWRQRSLIRDLGAGQDVTIEGTVTHLTARRAWHRRGTTIVDATLTDESGGKLHVVWFNLPWLAKTIKLGDQLFVSGTVTRGSGDRLQLNNPLFEKVGADEALHEKLVPVYRTTEGLSQRQIRLVMKQAVGLVNFVPDPLSPEIVRNFGLLPLAAALTNIHFPATPELGHQAVERLKFDELLAWHLRLRQTHQPSADRVALAIPFRETEVRSFVQHLPFDLTADQRVAAWQILQDLAQPKPMSRLVQGDVGSGKTVVAALVGYNAALNHAQVALVAPTVVLAEQHWQTFVRWLADRDINVGLLTGQAAKINTEIVSRSAWLQRLASGEIHIAIGTHAVFQPEVAFKQLGLVIVDEQQRFGVDQRQALLESRSIHPHFLSLTATPIPRSFALWLSGILSVSMLKSKPPGRAVISTEVLGPKDREPLAKRIAGTVAANQQVYIITPLIEESDSLGVRAAIREHQRWREQFPHLRVGLLHGSMPAADRVAILNHFREHQVDILVSTTVIEVGVDVPNATLMVIEGAERFGLSQLHQLRGRVGRSDLPSACLLVTDQDSPTVRQRLDQVADTTDGFAIAELDLRERGAGDVYGQRQSGLPAWQLASLSDTQVFKKVTDLASQLSETQSFSLLRSLRSTGVEPASFHAE